MPLTNPADRYITICHGSETRASPLTTETTPRLWHAGSFARAAPNAGSPVTHHVVAVASVAAQAPLLVAPRQKTPSQNAGAITAFSFHYVNRVMDALGPQGVALTVTARPPAFVIWLTTDCASSTDVA